MEVIEYSISGDDDTYDTYDFGGLVSNVGMYDHNVHRQKHSQTPLCVQGTNARNASVCTFVYRFRYNPRCCNEDCTGSGPGRGLGLADVKTQFAVQQQSVVQLDHQFDG